MIEFKPIGKGTSIGQADNSASSMSANKQKTPGTGPGGIGGAITGLLTSILQSPNTGGAGLGMFGDFDLDSFLETSLKKNQGGDEGGLGNVIGSIMKMFAGGG